MSKAIYCGYPASGHVNPTLGLVKELTARGETVIYYSNQHYRSGIEYSGALFKDDTSLSFIDQHLKNIDIEGFDPITVFIGFIANNMAMGKHIISSIFEEIKAANPDYIIHDSFSVWGKQIAKSLNIPAISTITLFALNNQMIELDPTGIVSNLIRTRITSAEASTERNENLYRRLWGKISRIISRDHGLENFDLIDGIMNKEELNIVFTSKEFQIFSETFDETFKFTGPSIAGRKETAAFPFEKLQDQPLIFISLGTMFYRNMEFYKKCFTAFEGADRQVVMSVGNETRLAELGEIPGNFIVRNYVPQIEILKRAGVFITHGGMNSINEGIYFQVPLVVFPQEADQFLVAPRVDSLGAGIYMKDPDISPTELRKITEKVISEASYRKKCQELSESLKNAGGSKRAADEIFQFKEQFVHSR
ncbi:MAG TPA: macrolide family glycosyltransferase [Bacillota bacterium]|nr:macrolide family glycosyltransferase [Bacillota bacterium]